MENLDLEERDVKKCEPIKLISFDEKANQFKVNPEGLKIIKYINSSGGA